VRRDAEIACAPGITAQAGSDGAVL